MNPRSLTTFLICVLWFFVHTLQAQDSEPNIVTYNDFCRLFPEAEKEGQHLKLLLDNSQVFVLCENKMLFHEVQLVLLHSTANKKDAIATANKLAHLLSPNCKVMPFAGKEPGAAIIMPSTPSLRNYKFSPMHAMFSDEPMASRDLIQFIGWKNGLLVTRITSTLKENKGTVEMVLDPRPHHVQAIQMRKIRGRIDFQLFLAKPWRLWGATSTPSSYNLEKGRKVLGVRHVSSYNDSVDFCIASKDKLTHYAGTIDSVNEALKQGLSAPAIIYPTEPHPWPNAEDEQENSGAATPPDDAASRQEKEDHHTPEKIEQQKAERITPAEALKMYLETLRRI